MGESLCVLRFLQAPPPRRLLEFTAATTAATTTMPPARHATTMFVFVDDEEEEDDAGRGGGATTALPPSSGTASARIWNGDGVGADVSSRAGKAVGTATAAGDVISEVSSMTAAKSAPLT